MGKYYVEGEQYFRTVIGGSDEEHHEHEHGDGFDWQDGPFDTLDDAKDACDSWLATEDPAAIHDDKRGIGYITWSVCMVFEEDEDGEWNPVDGADNLKPEIKAAYERAVGSYYGYLDYKSETYDTVSVSAENTDPQSDVEVYEDNAGGLSLFVLRESGKVAYGHHYWGDGHEGQCADDLIEAATNGVAGWDGNDLDDKDYAEESRWIGPGSSMMVAHAKVGNPDSVEVYDSDACVAGAKLIEKLRSRGCGA